MNSPRKDRIAIALAFASILALTGCGHANNVTPIPQPITGFPGYGQVGSGGCIPINQPIGFGGTGIYFDWANIVGGMLPQSTQPMGSMGVINGYPQQGGIGQTYQRSGSDGMITMSVTSAQSPYGSAPYPGYPSGTFPSPYGQQYPYTQPYQQQVQGLVNATGSIAISPLVQSDIIFRTGGGVAPGYPTQPGYPAQGNVPCVSGIAINLGHYYSTIYGGYVYLFLNGSQQHGYALSF